MSLDIDDLGGLERDALRYRWLRAHSAITDPVPSTLLFGPGLKQELPNELDAKIDRYMAKRLGGSSAEM